MYEKKRKNQRPENMTIAIAIIDGNQNKEILSQTNSPSLGVACYPGFQP